MRVITKLLIILSVWTIGAVAATITFKSGDNLNESNDHGPNVLITPHNVWATDPGGGLWVSSSNTGVGGGVLPNDINAPYATFTEEFTLPFANNVGTIDVWADDTATVELNGVQLALAQMVLGSNCAGTPISCTDSLGGHFTVNAPALKAGLNTLVIKGFQVGGAVAGVLYSGTVESLDGSTRVIEQVSTPEPGTIALLGIGLTGLGLLRARRRSN